MIYLKQYRFKIAINDLFLHDFQVSWEALDKKNPMLLCISAKYMLKPSHERFWGSGFDFQQAYKALCIYIIRNKW